MDKIFEEAYQAFIKLSILSKFRFDSNDVETTSDWDWDVGVYEGTGANLWLESEEFPVLRRNLKLRLYSQRTAMRIARTKRTVLYHLFNSSDASDFLVKELAACPSVGA